MTKVNATMRACLYTPLLALACAPVAAAPESVAPYFLMSGADQEPGHFELASTRVKADIVGMIADVEIVQVYRNRGTQSVEAIYVVPGSPHAAVYGFEVRIGNRILRAVAREKQEAREEFVKAREQGKRAALLEQFGEASFRMSVAHMTPGADVVVTLRYTELLVPEAGLYRLVLPSARAPRYTNDTRVAARDPVGDFSLEAALDAGVPIQAFGSPTHAAIVTRGAPDRWRLTISASTPLVEDQVVEYRLRGSELDAGVVLHDGVDEDFFLLTVQPPDQVTPEQSPPREYLFVIDAAGPLYGYTLESIRYLLAQVLGTLQPQDRFNVVLFAEVADAFRPAPVAADADAVREAIAFVGQREIRERIALLAGLDAALAAPRRSGVARSVVLVTDGYVQASPRLYDDVRARLAATSTFTFGIAGWFMDRGVLEALARAGEAEPVIVLDPSRADVEVRRFRAMVEAPVLIDVKAEFHGFEVYDLEPRTLPEVYGDRPAVMIGKYRGEPRGEIVLTGTTASGPWRRTIAVGTPRAKPEHSALAALWARRRIRVLLDDVEAEPRDVWKGEVIALGLRYSLATPYTSFVAVDEDVKEPEPAKELPVVPPAAVPAPPPAGEMALAVSDSGYAAGFALLERTLQLDGGLAAAGRTSANRPGVCRSEPTRAIVEALVVRRSSAAHRDLLALLPEHALCLLTESGATLALGGMTVVVMDDAGVTEFDVATLERLAQAAGLR